MVHHVSSLRSTTGVGHDINQPILELKEVSVRFHNAPALNDVSFQLHKGERVAVIGPNGAGKSTLFNVISGVLSPTLGNVNIYGHRPGEHICIAYVPQRSHVDWKFPVNVADVVMMGRARKLGLFRWPRRQDWDYVNDSLELVGMAHLAKRQIGELSGGQQQRVFIARALAQEAELMLMDEPLTGLDVKSQEEIFSILEKLRQRAVTIMVATHDLNLAAERFDRLMLLNGHILGFGKAKEVFTADLLNQAYSGQLRLIETANGTMVLSDTCCGGGEPHG
ncbi:MAG: metal ABC transporter ATP-binding protein [Anaerolineae bacterium]|nr:metal ABC transporter ATP-binding protein [Anaerolineae bacterium]